MLLVKIHRDALLRPLQIVSGIVERRHTLPILANILIRKDGEQVSFLSTDIEVQITTKAQSGYFDLTIASSTIGSFVELWDAPQTVVATSESVDRLECEQLIASGVVTAATTARIYWISSDGPIYGWRRVAYRIIAL